MPEDNNIAIAEVSRHIRELDGIRGLAILMVFSFHYIAIREGDSLGYLAAMAIVRSLWSGVDLFFVLSGFLITGILLDTKPRKHYFRNFFVRRALRITPLYFAVAVAVFLILPRLISFASLADQDVLSNQSWVWTYSLNIKIASSGFGPFLGDTVYLHHLWSLAVEEHFYLIWPWIVYWASPRSLRLVCISCVIIAVGLRVGSIFTSLPTLAPYVFTLSGLTH